MTFPPCRPLAALILLAAVAGLAFAPGNARAENHHTCEGFIDALPATISTQGVWCLRKDLATNIASGIAINIVTNNVTIDCNGFKIGGLAAGDISTAYGIRAHIQRNITVRNCNIRGFFYGISVGGDGHLIEDNRLDNNLYTGISTSGENSMVRRNRVYDTGGHVTNLSSYGIVAGGDIIDNTVAGVFTVASGSNATAGIRSIAGGVIRDNRVRDVAAPEIGSPVGIVVDALTSVVVENNQLTSAAATRGTGSGIVDNHFNSTMTTCRGNVIAGFSIALRSCANAGGNVAL